MPKQVRWRRGTTAEHASFTGAEGEVTVDITKKTLVVHDGVTPGGFPMNNTPGGSASAQALAISLAGTDTITPGATVLNHFVDATVSAGVSAYVRKLVLSLVGAVDGKRAAFHFTLPASANPTLEIRDATDTGTVLLSFSPRADEAVARSVDCEYRGGAWRLVDTNEITDHVRESLLTAKGQMLVREANDVAALAAPATDEFLMGDTTAAEGVAWKASAIAREAMLDLYRENPQTPSPKPLAAGDNSIALGEAAYARDAGHFARANGGFGDYAATAQRWEAIVRNQTSDATQTELFVDGASQRLVLPDDYTWHFEIKLAAREQAGESAAYHFMGCIKRGTGAASVALVDSVDSPMADKEDTAAWSVTVDADTTNGSLRVRVTGAAAKVIRWVASVDVVEVFNPDAGGGDPPPPVPATALSLYSGGGGYDPLYWDFVAEPNGNVPPWTSYRVYYEVGESLGATSDPTTASAFIDFPAAPVPPAAYRLYASSAAIKAAAWKVGYELGPVASAERYF